MPLVATMIAGAAFVVAIVAVGIIATREPEGVKEGVKPAAGAASGATAEAVPTTPGFVDLDVAAPDIFLLLKKGTFVESGATGYRVDDPDARKKLGLEQGDVVTMLSGREIASEKELRKALLDVSVAESKNLYVEVARARGSVVLRWKVSGDLRAAFFDADALPSSAGRTNPYATPDPIAPPDPIDPNDPFAAPRPPSDPDDLAKSIVRIDDTHANVPEAAIDKLLANPMSVMKGARVVPAMKNGKPEGIKLYAIRPGSVYAALNFRNGDTLVSINGEELTSIDKGLEIYTKLRDAKKFEIVVMRQGATIVLHVQIVK